MTKHYVTMPDGMRFEFRVIAPDGAVITEDFTGLTSIDEFGCCESVDLHVGAALRCVRRFVQTYVPEQRETV